jgi:hypothetical protein
MGHVGVLEITTEWLLVTLAFRNKSRVITGHVGRFGNNSRVKTGNVSVFRNNS